MNKQSVTTIMTHLVRAAFFLVLLFLAIIAISFAQGQRQKSRRFISNSELSRNGDLRGAGARRSQKDLEYDRTYRVDEHGNHAHSIGSAVPKGRNDRRAWIAGGGAWSLLGPPGGDVFDAAMRRDVVVDQSTGAGHRDKGSVIVQPQDFEAGEKRGRKCHRAVSLGDIQRH